MRREPSGAETLQSQCATDDVCASLLHKSAVVQQGGRNRTGGGTASPNLLEEMKFHRGTLGLIRGSHRGGGGSGRDVLEGGVTEEGIKRWGIEGMP